MALAARDRRNGPSGDGRAGVTLLVAVQRFGTHRVGGAFGPVSATARATVS